MVNEDDVKEIKNIIIEIRILKGLTLIAVGRKTAYSFFLPLKFMMNAFVLLMHVLIILQHVTKVVTGVMFLFHDLNNPM